MSEGTDRRLFFSELLRDAVGVVREVNRAIRIDPEPEFGQDEQWYLEPPLRARPTKRALTTGELLVLCEEAGLAARSANVRGLAQTSLRLTRAEPASGAWARSRLGGAPDLPAGFKWSTWADQELAFLGQVDLLEAAALDPKALLPARGLLLFFYDVAGQPSGLEPSHRGSWRVVHVEDDPARLHPDDTACVCFPEYPLQLSSELMLPRSWSPPLEALNLDPDEMAAWDGLREKLAHAQGIELEELTQSWQSLHRLLGYPEELGGGMELDCQLASGGISVEAGDRYLALREQKLVAGASDWRLLLQLSDDDVLGASWGEGFGRLSFWIREQDLHARAFDDVWAILR